MEVKDPDKSGIKHCLRHYLTFHPVSASYSTAASRTFLFRMSSPTPTTPDSLSLPFSPTGEEEGVQMQMMLVTVCSFYWPWCCCLCRVLKAGTELTWDYSANTQTVSLPKQEVPCLCGSNGCQGRFTIEENLCDVCEAEGPAAIEAHWSDHQVQTLQPTKKHKTIYFYTLML